MAPPSSDLVIDDLLTELGFETVEARALARGVIEDAGLTNTRKQRIAASKRQAVEEALRTAVIVACARAPCRDESRRSGLTVVGAAQASACQICGGSANRREMDRATVALLERGLRKLVVVGGSPATHDELRTLARGRIELRLVPGTDRRNAGDAKADLAWGDAIAVWGGTQLDHKVSKLYTNARQPHVFTCTRRGIAALAATLLDHLSRRQV